MVEKNLQENKTPTEGAESTPKTEEKKPTQEEKKTTVGKTYTQEELDKAVGKGIATLQQQATLTKAEAETAKAEVAEATLLREQAEAELATIQREHENLLADDPEKRQAYVDRHAISKAKAEQARKEAELKRRELEAEKRIRSASLAVKAVEVSRETGIPISELEACNTEADMENAGLKFKLTKLEEKQPEPTEPPPTFDTGISTGGGFPEHPTLEQLEKWTPEQYAEWVKKTEG